MGRVVDKLRPPVDLDRDHWRGGEHAAVTLVARIHPHALAAAHLAEAALGAALAAAIKER
jgi:hypothetical protein